jgi:hypothetical protein
MKVKDLIKRLKTIPQDKEVVIKTYAWKEGVWTQYKDVWVQSGAHIALCGSDKFEKESEEK